MDYLTSLLGDPSAWVALATLIAMEIILGIDNLLFISILTNKLPEHQRTRARRIGIGLALVMRLALLSMIFAIVQLTQPVLSLLGNTFSWRDMILICGGLFLLWKATKEIHHNVYPRAGAEDQMFDTSKAALGLSAAIGQIVALDIVFSVDSILTAVGMTDHVPIMVVAVLVAVLAMLFASDPLAKFINKHPTVVMLALGFLLMIGATLIAEGFGVHVHKGYIYAAMAFSAAIEALNIVARRMRGHRDGPST